MSMRFDSTLGFPGEGPRAMADARRANGYYRWVALAGRLICERGAFGAPDLDRWAARVVAIAEVAPPYAVGSLLDLVDRARTGDWPGALLVWPTHWAGRILDLLVEGRYYQHDDGPPLPQELHRALWDLERLQACHRSSSGGPPLRHDAWVRRRGAWRQR